MKQILSLVLVILLFTLCESVKILYVMPFSAKSHYIGSKNLALELAARGHDVYVITPYTEPQHPPNYHHIMVEPLIIWEKLFDTKINVFDMTEFAFHDFKLMLYRSGFMVNDAVFGSPEVQSFMNENHHIDLVICEVFYNEAFYMFAHKFQAPLVLFTTFGNSFKTNYYARNPLQLATAHHEYGISSDPFSFIGRLRNFYFTTFDWFMLKFWYLPKQLEYAINNIKDLPEPVPSIEDLMANVSLVLMNSHFTTDTPVAYLPNFIEVGGMHIKSSNTTLPQDLQEILDSAVNGVVFLSFGSNVQSKDLSEDKLAAILKVFGELKQTVLMKWEDDKIPNIPKNVHLKKWFPQKDILAHPNVKLFIGHGGLLGLQETIIAGVPILGVPVYSDQFLNVHETVINGHGEMLIYKDISEDKFRHVVNKMLNERRYMENARLISKRFIDRPMSAIDTATWWVEYVIRNKGANFMKSPSLKMHYLSYLMWDVYLFVTMIVLLVAYAIYKSTKFVIGLFIKSKSTRSAKQKKS